MTKTKKKKIIPQVKKCGCGRNVKNHHWLCDKCWTKKYKPIQKKICNQLKKLKSKTGNEVIYHNEKDKQN